MDGLIIVASVSLAELAGRIRDLVPLSTAGSRRSEEASERRHGAIDQDVGSVPASAGSPEPVSGLASDLAELLPAARAIRDELVRQGRAISRDALAARLRRDGYSIRNTRASELVAILKAEMGSPNGARRKPPG